MTSSFNYCCLAPALTGASATVSANNLTNEPGLAGWQDGEYRLKSDSRCVNAGAYQEWMANAVDLDGHARLDRFSRIVDIGCFEYVPKGILFNLK